MTTGPTDQTCCVATANGGCKYIVNYLNVFFFVSVFNHHFQKIEILYVHQFVLKRVHGAVRSPTYSLENKCEDEDIGMKIPFKL